MHVNVLSKDLWNLELTFFFLFCFVVLSVLHCTELGDVKKKKRSWEALWIKRRETKSISFPHRQLEGDITVDFVKVHLLHLLLLFVPRCNYFCIFFIFCYFLPSLKLAISIGQITRNSENKRAFITVFFLSCLREISLVELNETKAERLMGKHSWKQKKKENV